MHSLKKSFSNILLALTLCVTAGYAQAGTSTITFDEVGIAHGTVLNTQFSGVTISAENFSDGPDLAVAYDTSDTTNGRDEDLEGPTWGNNNLAQFGIDASSYSSGNAVIIQENNRGCGDGVCNHPDDEGSRPSGTVTFDFDMTITSLAFDLIDFEDVESRNSNVTFYNDAMQSITYTFASFMGGVHNAVYGDNSINRILLGSIGISNANRAVFDFGGSGAVDTIKYTTSTDVPEPSTLALLAFAVFGLTRARRRQTNRIN